MSNRTPNSRSAGHIHVDSREKKRFGGRPTRAAGRLWLSARRILGRCLPAARVMGIVIGLLAVPGLAGSAMQVAQETEDVTVVKGLMERRLYDLARFHCQQILQEAGRSQAEKIEIAIADLQVRTQQAMQSPPAMRDAMWRETESTARSYLNDFAGSPRSILIKVQEALVVQSKIEQLRQEIDADMAPPDASPQALQLIRVAIRQFEDALREIEPLMRTPPGDREALSPLELLALKHHVQYQIARCYLHRALLYRGEQNIDRTNALTRVSDLLDSVLQSATPDQNIWWEAQRDRIAVARHLKKYDLAESIVGQLPKDNVPAAARAEIEVQMIQLLVQQGKLADASELADLSPAASHWPPLDLARVDLMVALSGDSQQTPQQQKGWQKFALELTKQIGEAHGGYWHRRANLLVMGKLESSASPENVDMLVLVANEAQRKGQWSEAVKALDAAAERARTLGNNSLTFKLMYRAAAIEQEQQDYRAAAERYAAAATEFPEQEEAAAAHLMACWNFVKTIGQDPQRLERYQSMLEFNIDTWPDSAPADQTRIWLARLWHNQGNWPAAIQQLLGVALTSPLLTQALRELDDLIDRYVAESHREGNSPARLLRLVADRIVPVVDPNPPPAETWTETTCEIVLLLCKLFIHGAELDVDLTSLVRSAAERSESANFACGPRAAAWNYVISIDELTSSGRQKQLREKLTDADEVLDIVLLGLSVEMQRDADRSARLVPALFIEFQDDIERLGDRLPAAKQRAWKLKFVEAYQLAGNFTEAVRVARSLAEQFSDDAEIQELYSDVLTRQSDAQPTTESFNAAILQWRRLAQRAKPNSSLWFKAKYHVALMLKRQGKNEDARKLLKYMQAVPPGWSGSSWAAEFEALLAELRD